MMYMLFLFVNFTPIYILQKTSTSNDVNLTAPFFIFIAHFSLYLKSIQNRLKVNNKNIPESGYNFLFYLFSFSSLMFYTAVCAIATVRFEDQRISVIYILELLFCSIQAFVIRWLWHTSVYGISSASICIADKITISVDGYCDKVIAIVYEWGLDEDWDEKIVDRKEVDLRKVESNYICDCPDISLNNKSLSVKFTKQDGSKSSFNYDLRT